MLFYKYYFINQKQVPKVFTLTTTELCPLLSGYPVIKNDLEQGAFPLCRWWQGMGYTKGKTCSSQHYIFVAKFPVNANQALQNLDHLMYVSYH